MKTHWKTPTLLLIAIMALSGCHRAEKEVINPSVLVIHEDAVQSSSPYKMHITANFVWRIECSDSWVNVSPEKGSGDKDLEVYISPNTSLNQRETKFFIVGEQIRQEIKVVQKGETPQVTLKEVSATASAAGGEVAVEVSTNVEIDISINQLWVSLVPIGTKTVSTGRYYFKVDQNTAMESRTARITFKQKGGTATQEFTITQSGESPDLLVDKSTMTVEAAGGIRSIEVTSNVPWSAYCSKEWLTFGPVTKLMEKSTCVFTVEENKRAETREAVVIFSKANSPLELTKMVTVTQEAAAPTILCSPTAFSTVPAAQSGTAAKYSVTVFANFTPTVSAGSAWVYDIVFDATSGICTFRVLANEGLALRTTSILFKLPNGTLVKEYPITQAGAAPQITTLPDQANMPTLFAEGGVDPSKLVYIFVTSNVTWRVVVDQPWLSVDRSTYINNPDMEVLTCSATKNSDSAPRTAKITLVSDYVSRVITLTQLAGSTQMKVTSAKKIEVTADQSTRELKVTSNVKWNASSKATWIQFQKAPATKSPLGDSTILVNVVKNTSLLARKDTIFITQAGDGLKDALKDTVLAFQDGAVPTLTVTPSVGSLKGPGGVVTLTLSANFPVALASVDKSWAVVTADSTGTPVSGSKSYRFAITPTDLTVPRTALITFKNIGGDLAYTQTYNLVQQGATITAGDSTVLVKLNQALSGAIWSTRWNLSRPVAEWSGVTLTPVEVMVNGERRVEEINLASVGLLGFLENGIVVSRVPLEDLTGLRKLNLSGNPGLGGELPVNLYRIGGNLRELNLSNCNFVNSGSRNIPAEWGKDGSGTLHLPNLQVLRVNGNSLSGTVPQALVDHDLWTQWNAATYVLPQKGGPLVMP